MAERGAERNLDAALAALVEAALRRAGEAGEAPPAEQARLVAQALAVGLRELVRAPLREALQAGYDLGWRAAQEAQRAAQDVPRPAANPAPLPEPSVASTSSPAAGAAGPAPGPLVAAPDPTECTAGAHQVCLEVAPLPSFSAVNRFHAAVAGVPGVADTTMVAFRDGRLTLQVEHPDGAALAAALRALDLGPLRVLAATAERVELAVESRPPPASARMSRESRRKPAAPS